MGDADGIDDGQLLVGSDGEELGADDGDADGDELGTLVG